MTDAEILERAVQENAFIGYLPHVCVLLSAEIRRLRRRSETVQGLTDTGSAEFRQAFPPKSAGDSYFPREGVPGWRVVEKIREILLDG